MTNEEIRNAIRGGFRLYVTKSKSGHYRATARHRIHGGLVKKTVLGWSTPDQAVRNLWELLNA